MIPVTTAGAAANAYYYVCTSHSGEYSNLFYLIHFSQNPELGILFSFENLA